MKKVLLTLSAIGIIFLNSCKNETSDANDIKSVLYFNGDIITMEGNTATIWSMHPRGCSNNLAGTNFGIGFNKKLLISQRVGSSWNWINSLRSLGLYF